MQKGKIQKVGGDLSGRGMKFAVVLARFNGFIGERLLSAALEALEQAGARVPRDVRVVRVPGAFEIPQAAYRLAKTGKYSAIITLGCVIRGETPHFDYVCAGCAKTCIKTSVCVISHKGKIIFCAIVGTSRYHNLLG